MPLTPMRERISRSRHSSAMPSRSRQPGLAGAGRMLGTSTATSAVETANVAASTRSASAGPARTTRAPPINGPTRMFSLRTVSLAPFAAARSTRSRSASPGRRTERAVAPGRSRIVPRKASPQRSQNGEEVRDREQGDCRDRDPRGQVADDARRASAERSTMTPPISAHPRSGTSVAKPTRPISAPPPPRAMMSHGSATLPRTLPVPETALARRIARIGGDRSGETGRRAHAGHRTWRRMRRSVRFAADSAHQALPDGCSSSNNNMGYCNKDVDCPPRRRRRRCRPWTSRSRSTTRPRRR